MSRPKATRGSRSDLNLVSAEPNGRFLAEYHDRGRIAGAVIAGLVRHLPHYRNEITRE